MRRAHLPKPLSTMISGFLASTEKNQKKRVLQSIPSCKLPRNEKLQNPRNLATCFGCRKKDRQDAERQMALTE